MVHFVGAGPGAPDLITLRGAALLEAADDIIAMAEAEGLRAHANAIRKRQNAKG